jgi:hypothetical protein
MKIDGQGKREKRHLMSLEYKEYKEYKVPRLLWENLESVLLAQSKRYIGELAKRLGVSEKELQKKVLPTSDTLKVTIQDNQAESSQCKAYIQQDTITMFCRKSVAYQSEFCAFHRLKRMTVIDGMNPIILQKVKDHHDMEPLWIDKNILLNSCGEMVGKVNMATKVMTIYKVETPKSS